MESCNGCTAARQNHAESLCRHYGIYAVVRADVGRKEVLHLSLRGLQGCPSGSHSARLFRRIRWRYRQLGLASTQGRFHNLPRLFRPSGQTCRVFCRQCAAETTSGVEGCTEERGRGRFYNGYRLPRSYQPLHVVVCRCRETAGTQPCRHRRTPPPHGHHAQGHGA